MAATILYRDRVSEISTASAEGEHLWVPVAELERATGWQLKPEGACLGEVCVPLPRDGSWLRGDRFDLAALAKHLGDPVVHDDEGRVWLFAEPAEVKRGQLLSGEAPDFALPDLTGRMHRLSDYRGKKVLLYAWASW
jgi:hypothetical protein